MIAQEFQVVRKELTDGSDAYDVVGFDGFHKVTFNAIDAGSAIAITTACNKGANAFKVETLEHPGPDRTEFLVMSTTKLIKRIDRLNAIGNGPEDEQTLRAAIAELQHRYS